MCSTKSSGVSNRTARWRAVPITENRWSNLLCVCPTTMKFRVTDLKRRFATIHAASWKQVWFFPSRLVLSASPTINYYQNT